MLFVGFYLIFFQLPLLSVVCYQTELASQSANISGLEVRDILSVEVGMSPLLSTTAIASHQNGTLSGANLVYYAISANGFCSTVKIVA